MLHAPTEDYLHAFAAAFRRLKATPEERHPTSGFTCAPAALPCRLLTAKSVTLLQHRCSALYCTLSCITPAGTRQHTALGIALSWCHTVLAPDTLRCPITARETKPAATWCSGDAGGGVHPGGDGAESVRLQLVAPPGGAPPHVERACARCSGGLELRA